ncbi:MAG: hypothetical protein JSU59_06010 [Nitrospirota bacterium]|nr:MAG: hypothetical protein JSU59_06010 [Nitrospirota bacterium]
MTSKIAIGMPIEWFWGKNKKMIKTKHLWIHFLIGKNRKEVMLMAEC